MTYAITANLAAILRALRYPDQHRYLWVDAVCVFVVYREAKRVFAWVGEQLDSAF
jgi:hypothetical protein